MNDVLCTMQKLIFRYEGFLRQFLVDDKGCTLIAVFGAPLAHEDDAIRAIAVALSIQYQLKYFGLDCSIGVT